MASPIGCARARALVCVRVRKCVCVRVRAGACAVCMCVHTHTGATTGRILLRKEPADTRSPPRTGRRLTKPRKGEGGRERERERRESEGILEALCPGLTC